jgi:hypothetical protein
MPQNVAREVQTLFRLLRENVYHMHWTENVLPLGHAVRSGMQRTAVKETFCMLCLPTGINGSQL